jgi:hypothetical protein
MQYMRFENKIAKYKTKEILLELTAISTAKGVKKFLALCFKIYVKCSSVSINKVQQAMSSSFRGGKFCGTTAETLCNPLAKDQT